MTKQELMDFYQGEYEKYLKSGKANESELKKNVDEEMAYHIIEAAEKDLMIASMCKQFVNHLNDLEGVK